MNTQPMPTRDLVLRLCDEAGELNSDWLATGEKVAVPFPASFGPEAAQAIVAAARTMGADELMVCQTRAEHIYEPVQRLAARSADLTRLVAGWGADAVDLLIALPDESAAVLVTGGGVTVGAGPVPFVQALVGPDIAAAKEDFGEFARRRRDDTALRATAERYGCLEPAGSRAARHARDAGVPRADTAERLCRASERISERHPDVTGGFRLVKTVLAWATVALLIVVCTSVPGTPRAIGAVLGLGWLLVQLCLLARSRTVTFAVGLRVAVLGALVAIPAVFVERALIERQDMVATDPMAAVRIGAPVEEIAKLVPLVVVWLFARRRFKRLTCVDYLLLAAFAGAGFQLAENSVQLAVTQGSTAAAGFPHFGFFSFLPGWIDGVNGARFPGHAVLTGLIGGCVGVAAVGRRRFGRKLWLLPVLALAIAIFTHVAFDATLAGRQLRAGADLGYTLLGHGHLVRTLFFVLLVGCVLLDHRMFRAVDDVVPPLPGSPVWSGLERVARGAGIRIRTRVPGEAAPVFHGFARAVAGLVVTAAEALVRIGHEWAVLLVALSRGAPILPVTLRFVRRRRELAAAAYRAAGRPRRDVPAKAAVRQLADGVGQTLRIVPAYAASSLVVAVLAGSAGLAVLAGLAGRSAQRGPPDGAFLALYVRPLLDWLARFTPQGQLLAGCGAAALLFVLLTSWSVPDLRPPGRGAFLRDPRGASIGVLRDLGPGRLPFLLLCLAGLAVPGRVDRLLAGHAATPVTVPRATRVPSPPEDAALVVDVPQPAGVMVTGPQPPDEAWEFPEDRLVAALKHAADFGLTPGTSFDVPALRATLLAFVVEPGTLRMDITFRGRAARAVVDRTRGRVVVFTPPGVFVICLLLTESQLATLLAEHQL